MVTDSAKTVLATDLRALERFRCFVRQVLTEHEIPSPADNHLELAVIEAVSNIIRHGCDSELGEGIRCEFRFAPEEITVELIYHGSPFNPPDHIPEITEPAEGGMGLFLIQQCVDDSEYREIAPGLQCLRLSKQTPVPFRCSL